MRDKTFVSVYFPPNKKEERFLFPSLKEVFPFPTSIKIKSMEFTSKSLDEDKLIILEDEKNLCCHIIGQKIILEDGEEFIRKVNIRHDDTGHDGTRTHLNIDLLTSYPILPASKNKKKHYLKKTHLLDIKEKGIQPLHVFVFSTPGSSIQKSLVVLPTQQDVDYHLKEKEFFDKIKKRTATEKDRNEFKKQFDKYSSYIQGVFK